jgi:hypothetical protein
VDLKAEMSGLENEKSAARQEHATAMADLNNAKYALQTTIDGAKISLGNA